MKQDPINLRLRLARIEDIPTLLEFEQGVIEEERPYNDSIRESNVNYYDLPHLLADPNANLQLAEHDGQVVGCGYAQLRPSKAAFKHDTHAYLGFMYVKPDFRGQGINKLIVESLVNWIRERGVCDVYLDVYASNRAAVRAYEEAGFTSTLGEMKLSLNRL